MKYNRLLQASDLFMKLATISVKEAYDIIGISPNATPDEINKAYKKQMFQVHPDRNPSPEAAQKVIELNNARDILLHPEREGFAADLKRQYEDLGTILDEHQRKADQWASDIAAQRREYDEWSAGKIKDEQLAHPDNIEHVRQFREKMKEQRKLDRQRRNKTKKK